MSVGARWVNSDVWTGRGWWNVQADQRVGRPAIIGITGHMGAGKDTLASYFIREHGFVRVGFADALKDEVRTRLPRTLALIGGTDSADYVLDHKPPLIRALLQEYGTQVRRRDDPNYWINRWVDRLPTGDVTIVTPDVRFENEAQRIVNLGGMVVRVERPGYHGNGHESEQLVWAYSHVFQNTGTVEELEKQAAVWYTSLGES